MEKRKFTIEIYNRCDWYIEIAGVKDFEDYPYFGGKMNYSFGGSRSTEDGKIARIFDIDVRDSDLKKAQTDERFKETCEFIHNDHTFKGTFIDALEYIKKELHDGQ